MSYSNSNIEWRSYVLKALGMIVLINGLLLPTTEVILKDHVTKRIGKIDNLPMAFALPVGILEEFGHIITLGFEQVYAPIEMAAGSGSPVFSYYNYGMLFGARLKKELSQVRIKDPEFVENMRSFMKQCVVLPAMIGYQFTPKQLIETPDIWKLVSSKAGALTRLYVRGGENMKNITCKEATGLFESYFAEETKRVFSKNAGSEFALAKGGSDYAFSAKSANSNSALNILSGGAYVGSNGVSSIFEKNIKALYGDNQPAGNILRQQMMINSISDYASSNYSVARARTNQENGWLLSSDMANLYLPMLLVVIKCIVYASFMFLVPMLIFSGGIAKYASYLTLVASLQLWPALNSIINMIMGTYSHLKTGSSLMLSYSSVSAINNHVDTIVTVAAGLQMIVPFIAFAIMQSGVTGLGHLAGSIIGGMQQMSGTIGAEAASGNKSIDNVSEGNRQSYVRSGHKTDYNMQYVEGGQSFQQADGVQTRINPDGSTIYAGGQGVNASVGSSKFNLEQASQNQISQGIQTSEGLLRSDQRSLSTAQSRTFSKTADFVSSLAQREHSGETIDYSKAGEYAKSLQQAVHNARVLNEKYGYGWNQATRASLTGNASYSTPLKGITGFGLSSNIDGAISAQNSSDQSFGEESDISRQNNTNESYVNIVKAASSTAWGQDNSNEKHYSEAVRSSYEEQQRLEDQVSMRQETVDNWHKAKNRLESEGATMSKDMYQEVLDRCVMEFGMDANSIRKLVDKGHPEVMKVWNKIATEKLSSFMPEINSAKQQVSGQQAQKALNSFSSEHSNNKVMSKNPATQVKEEAFAKGINANSEEFAASIHEKQEQLKDQYQKVTSKNTEQYDNVKQANELGERDLQKQVDKYEKDRIGQGETAKKAAGALNIITFGATGETIGGSTKGEQKATSLNKGAYQHAKQSDSKVEE